MKFFIDECLSRQLARRLNALGFDAVHPLDVGRRGEPDHRVVARCLEEDRIIVAQNAGDFRKLVGRQEVHPGLVVLPNIGRGGPGPCCVGRSCSFKRRRTVEPSWSTALSRSLRTGR